MILKIYSPFNEKYLWHSPKISNSFLHIYGAGIVFPDSRYEFNKEKESYLFEYIAGGKGFIVSNGKNREVLPGDCIVAAQHGKIHYGADKNNPYIKLWFSVNGTYVDSLYKSCCQEPFVVRSVNTYPLFEKMFEMLEKNGNTISVSANIILNILLAVCGYANNYESNPQSKAKLFKLYMDSFVESDVNFEKAAMHIGVSQRQATKLFKEEYGITPTKYLRVARLQAAKKLLESTEKTVSEIAQTLRFCDQSYFSSVFKKEFGMYPSEYKLSIKNKTP